MYAPTWEDTLESSVPVPHTVEEILLNRSSYTQACVERNRSLIEDMQKQLFVQYQEQNKTMEAWRNEVDGTISHIKKQIFEAVFKIENLQESMKKQEIALSSAKSECSSVRLQLVEKDKHLSDIEIRQTDQAHRVETRIKTLNKLVVDALTEEQRERNNIEKKLLSKNEQGNEQVENVLKAVELLLEKVEIQRNHFEALNAQVTLQEKNRSAAEQLGIFDSSKSKISNTPNRLIKARANSMGDSSLEISELMASASRISPRGIKKVEATGRENATGIGADAASSITPNAVENDEDNKHSHNSKKQPEKKRSKKRISFKKIANIFRKSQTD